MIGAPMAVLMERRWYPAPPARSGDDRLVDRQGPVRDAGPAELLDGALPPGLAHRRASGVIGDQLVDGLGQRGGDVRVAIGEALGRDIHQHARLAEVDDRGVLTRYRYDGAGRLERVQRGAASVAYRYDASGRVTQARTARVSCGYGYDERGRVTAISQTIDGITIELRLGFDGAGRLATLALPGGAVVSYRWNERGRPDEVHLNDRAIASFDSSRGVRFESYCELRVKGALLDELRSQDWLPRPWRHRLEQRKRVREMLRARWNREPVDEELARAMGMQLSEYQQIFGTGMPGAPSGGGGFPGTAEREEVGGLEIVADTNSDAPGDKLTRDELMHLVTQRLTDQEYRIVYLKYWEELPMREIGTLAGLSESRVCKIHARLIDRLEADGLVERISCDTDRRGQWAQLTAGGYERLRGASPTHLRGVACHFLDRIPDAELETLQRTLERVTETA